MRSTGIVVSKGQGSYLFGDGGERYLDAVSGFGVASLGHSHPRWVEAVVAQADRLVVNPFYGPELAEYVSALSGVLPPKLGQVALYSGGAEAVESAIRLAQTFKGRPGIVTFSPGFHGKTTVGVRYSSNPTSTEALSLAPDWFRVLPFPACEAHDAVSYSGCRESADETLAQLCRRPDLDDVGTVLVEPILGTSGNVPPRRGFLPELRRLCDERGWILIFDELITGFGRTGKLFAFEEFAATPDILVLGKGIGGGFPLSAVCAAGELWDGSALAFPASTSSSFGGNPLACAAGLATLEILTDDDFLAQVCTVAGVAAQRLRELAAASPRVSRPRGAGLMLGFDLVNPATGSLASGDECLVTFRACRDRGLLILADVPRVRISPPLTISESEVHLLFDLLSEVLV
ncbi:MAG TPA: aspartate aminotransferase family protein [Solirubrobacterales bacterium]|nr:aspartate aminotransferase family protein [Solirubrobacterales bacterium]